MLPKVRNSLQKPKGWERNLNYPSNGYGILKVQAFRESEQVVDPHDPDISQNQIIHGGTNHLDLHEHLNTK
jgi:hypothetical protein